MSGHERRATIVVADDDAFMLTYLAGCLEQSGFDVQTAENGNQVLAICRRMVPDLVITDIFMPDQDGLGLIRLLRRELPSLPIIAISGGRASMRGDFLAMARRFGAQDVLAKPFQPDALLEAVTGVLQSRPPVRS